MYLISYLKQGFGNKVFIFANIVYFYLELKKKYPQLEKLYIAEAHSKHQINPKTEKFKFFFPNIQDIKWIEFVNLYELDELKKGCQIIDQDKLISVEKLNIKENRNIYFEPNYNVSIVPFHKYFNLFNKTLKLNKELITENKYDFENDIFMHIRYGDKLEIVMRGKRDFVVLKPEFYLDSLKLVKSIRNQQSPVTVHVFTDSEEIVKEVFTPYFEKMKDFNFIISDEPYWNVFYLATKFKNLIISNSSLVNAGLMLNRRYENAIAFKYEVNSVNNHSPWPNTRPKGYLIENPLLEKDYVKIDNKTYMF